MPEVRLIDANELKRLIVSGNDLIFDKVTECEILHMIDYQPTIDAEPVKHGRWLSYTGTHYTGKENEYGDPEYKEHIFYVCSNCRRKTVVREHFCPNCGARMGEPPESEVQDDDES